MKVLLTTLNAKFVHTSLALWYIYQYCRNDFPGLKFREFNINQDLAWVFGEIYSEKADVVGFSCNIWNIEQTLILTKRLKALAPQTFIVLGGPEVWREPEQILDKNPQLDLIVVGEGELTFKEWLEQLLRDSRDWESIPGLVFRREGSLIRTPARKPVADLNRLPFPYPEDLTDFRQKLVYYETSRGCPYQCQYCLSANERGVRFFDLERVKGELLKFINAKIAQVKLVDRSFNCNVERAKEIWRFLIEHQGETNFHFEICGDLLDDESIDILSSAPSGLFQFEIGVQSTNQETLRLIKRRMDFDKLKRQVSRLHQRSKVFIHLDLIAGLPGEDYQSFADTFNDNLLIEPDRLQLGFLKLLKGSGLRERAAEYGYRFTEESPYEVLANRWITYDELLRLKTIEDLLERYYNSGRFKATFKYLIKRSANPFQLFEDFAQWWKKRGLDQKSHKVKELYQYLLDFCQTRNEDGRIIGNLLKYDLLLGERMVELPEWAGRFTPELKKISHRFWRSPENRERYLPEWSELKSREIQRKTLFAEFEIDPEAAFNDPLNEPPLQPTLWLFIYGREVKAFKLDKEALKDV
ncbi:MAG: B12-binding domain-containing radical SAM protein [Firmicutes bacterium]|nr:B12-binding domain-containing radical SAM protein [Bacillota bacterium]